jgi:SAM-dependent methyltransferase
MNALERAEYVTLRLVRRFVFSERMANRAARWLPYYASNQNEQKPEQIVSNYVDRLHAIGLHLQSRDILEVGAGRVNLVGYGLVAAGAASATLLEPYVAFDAKRDSLLLKSHPDYAHIDRARVSRVPTFDEIKSGSVQVLLSNSVLEHVRDLTSFFRECKRVLAPDGIMLHLVDYRDHFFKYPYGFLIFSSKTWSRWLDPGDLPRWRLPDHVRAMRSAGFEVAELERASQPDAFEEVRDQLAPQFQSQNEDVEVTFAALMAALPVQLEPNQGGIGIETPTSESSQTC